MTVRIIVGLDAQTREAYSCIKYPNDRFIALEQFIDKSSRSLRRGEDAARKMLRAYSDYVREPNNLVLSDAFNYMPPHIAELYGYMALAIAHDHDAKLHILHSLQPEDLDSLLHDVSSLPHSWGVFLVSVKPRGVYDVRSRWSPELCLAW